MTLSLNTKFLGNLINDQDLKNISDEIYAAKKKL